MSNARAEHQLTKEVKLLHKVAVFWNGKVLLIRRDPQSATRPEKWDVPGGNSEWPTDLDENIHNPHQDDVAREIIEEIGLTVNPATFSSNNLVYFHTFFDAQKQVYSAVCGWRLNLEIADQPTITLSHEHTEYVWIDPSEVGNFDFGFAQFIPQTIEAATK